MKLLNGYTTLMSPEAMKLPYLETLLSWSKICNKIGICYSQFPKLDIPVPDGAVKPWDDDGSYEILQKFDTDMLGGKLLLHKHTWDTKEPREDGRTKSIARRTVHDFDKETPWLVQFDADEILQDRDEFKVLEVLSNNVQNNAPLFATGILEFFGGNDQVRFGFGNWHKIRFTRNTMELYHDMPIWARGRNPRTGKIVAVDNKDDGAGFIARYTLNRPPLPRQFWLSNVEIFSHLAQAGRPNVDVEKIYDSAARAIESDNDASGIWIYHTSWIDISRKWSMGWFFDNFWAVLNGQQDTFEEKAETNGRFTHTRSPDGLDLEAELKRELDRPGIRPISIPEPAVFQQVAEWRKANGYEW